MNRQERRHPTSPTTNSSATPVKTQTAEFYQGSIPPPAMLDSFGKVDPSFPERIMRMAEAAGERQSQQLFNQKLQIELESKEKLTEIEASAKLKEMEIKARNSDNFLKNIIGVIGLVAGIAVCAVLLYFSYLLLMADKTGGALIAASPMIGITLVSAIKIFKSKN